MNDKKTYGQIVFEHHEQGLQLEDDIIEYRRQMEPDIMMKVRNTAREAFQLPQYQGKALYVVLLKKVERLGQAPRTFVFARHSCPSPVYKQSVWKYHANGDEEFLWSIPDWELYYHILANATQFLQDPETSDLAKFVTLMESGELLKWIIKENGEKPDGIIKIKKQEDEDV